MRTTQRCENRAIVLIVCVAQTLLYEHQWWQYFNKLMKYKRNVYSTIQGLRAQVSTPEHF